MVWTLIGLFSMGVVGLLFTGSIAVGGGMALVNAIVGFLCYLIYERVWAGIRWGRQI
ncbi:putative membrane protein [Sagittula marina]|uniref:Putative membrane protein n=1 Tax=Sagittula marina TaxID=943940 RepID=A0A7W6DLR6_9RHOB|nr:putative membrane protein [Sagittula marina]